MKRFFAKATKPFAINTDIANDPGAKKLSSKKGHESKPSFDASNIPPISKGLKPKYLLPAVTHPCPHDHLAIAAVDEGLLIRPFSPGQSPQNALKGPTSYVKVSWKTGEVTELHYSNEKKPADHPSNAGPIPLIERVNWEEAVVVYGIVGMLELFSCSYLLVITARGEVGHIIDPIHKVYSVNGVSAIPLLEDRARKALSTIAHRNSALARPSLVLRHPETCLSPSDVTASILSSNAPDSALPSAAGPRVQFSADPEVKIMTPKLTPVTTSDDGDFDPALLQRPSSSQSFRSDISTPSSENSIATSPVFKTLAARLSFWSRVNKRSASMDAPLSEFAMTDYSVPHPTSLAEERETIDMLLQAEEEPAKVVEAIVNSTAPPPATTEEKHTELEDKVVRECIREFTKGGMYFAYTFDVTRSLQHKQEQIAKSQKQHALLGSLGALPSSSGPHDPTTATIDEGIHSPYPKDGAHAYPLAEPNPTLPLWRRVDKQFWWNESMAKPFIDAGVHPYVLPIMQGYVQTAVLPLPVGELDFEVDENGEEVIGDHVNAEYVIISRRSRYRAGLRYQRRGIDEEANAANFVETETIMRVQRDTNENVFSYVQIRGSVPLFWTQSGYSLKPPPVLAPDSSRAQNLDALARHFKRTLPRYGPHTIMNLAEQSGREGAISHAYKEYVTELGSKDIQYCDYDFHHETKGMKYENIGKLVDSMESTFATQGYLWISNETALSHQRGVFRVNCIDCLDRTNVVQSAFARYVLTQQLGAVALRSPFLNGSGEADFIFNDVWANNGDAISRAYAGTSALKGDFTRTGKRDLSGMLNDGVNSLARMYTATFGDWFSQAVIDFMLGHRTKAVFSEFLLKLQSTDPRDLIRLSKIRAEAVATATSRVLAEGEHLRSGWTLFAPEEVGVTVGDKFEEKVLLLSSKALYIVSYDYTLEKVKMYIRVPLGDIVEIKKGAYIISPLEESSRDPDQNYGFTISWLTKDEEARATSYSVRNDIMSPVTRSNSLVSPTALSRRKSGPLGSGGLQTATNSHYEVHSGPRSLARRNTGPFALPSPSAESSRSPGIVARGAGASALPATPRTSDAPKGALGGLNNLFNFGRQASVPVASTSSAAAGTTPSTSQTKAPQALSFSSMSILGDRSAAVPDADTSFAAFKVLPVDPARIRRASSYTSAYSEMSEEMHAGTCREAGEMIVESIASACEDAGGGSGRGRGWVRDEDIVSLAEANRMTSVYAKLEYGMKRLLWLGG